MRRLLTLALFLSLTSVAWADTQTHATDCPGTFSCTLPKNGEECFEQDNDTFYVCDGSVPGWVVGGSGTGSGTFDDDDATPDVSGSSYWLSHSDSGDVITGFDYGTGVPVPAGIVFRVQTVPVKLTYDCTDSGLLCGTGNVQTENDEITTWIGTGGLAELIGLKRKDQHHGLTFVGESNPRFYATTYARGIQLDGALQLGQVQYFAKNDATPSVENGTFFYGWDCSTDDYDDHCIDLYDSEVGSPCNENEAQCTGDPDGTCDHNGIDLLTDAPQRKGSSDGLCDSDATTTFAGEPANTPVTITDFNDGIDGQYIKIVTKDDITYDCTSASLKCNDGAAFLSEEYDFASWVYNALTNDWHLNGFEDNSDSGAVKAALTTTNIFAASNTFNAQQLFKADIRGEQAEVKKWGIGILGRAEFAGYLRADTLGTCTLAGCNDYMRFGSASEDYFWFSSTSGDVILDAAVDMLELADYEPLFGAGYGAYWVKNTSPPTPWFTEGDGNTKDQIATLTDPVFLNDVDITANLTVGGNIIQTLGTRNVIIGDATTGNGGVTTDSIAIGDAAGASMTAGGITNVVIGTNAGTAITTSDGSVIVGHDAGTAATTTTGTFIGFEAGKLTTASENTFIGYRSGAANTTSTQNTFIGHRTGLISTGAQNTFIGASTGSTVTTGGSNTLIGVDAAPLLEDGASNVVIGSEAGSGLVSGAWNTIVGKAAGGGGDFTAGTFFGYRAGQVTTGSGISAFGLSALRSNTSGADNTAFGKTALELNTTGGQNTAVGSEALGSLVAGATVNTAVGYRAGHRTNAGSDHNNAFGGWTLRGAGEHFRNQAFGYAAGIQMTTGDDNLLFGHEVGFGLTTANQNTMVGNYAGRQTTGHRNVFLGYYAGRNQVAVNDKLIIDNRSQGSAAADLTDALIVGDFHATPASQALRFNAQVSTLGNFTTDGGVLFFSETTTPTPVANYGAIYTKNNNELFFQDGAGAEHLIHGDSFSEIWFHNPVHSTAPVTVAIAAEDAFTKIDSFTVVGNEDDLANLVGSSANDNLTLSGIAGGEYEVSFHGSVTATGGADKDMLVALGITLATPKDITDVTDDTVSPIVITSTAHGLENGDMVEIVGVLVNTAANGSFIANNKTANTFEIVALDGTATTGNGDYDEGTPTGDVTIEYPGNMVIHRSVRGGSLGAISATGLHVLYNSDVLAIYVANLVGNTDLTVAAVSFDAFRIGN